MKRLIVASSAGFCMGVKRALAIAEKAAVSSKHKVFTLGPIIHNRLVIQELEQKDICAISSIEEDTDRTPVIIRAHGVPPEIYERLDVKGIPFYDATCPKVKAVQKIISGHAAKGYDIIIVGDLGHAEVISLLGFACGRGIVISTWDDLATVDFSKNYCVVAQTTQDVEFYLSVKEHIQKKNPKNMVFNTICDSTRVRQNEAITISKQADAMIVIGDKKSANTTRLVQLCGQESKKTYHVETAAELPLDELKKYDTIGVTAGASTPSWIIQEVVNALESIIG